MRLNTLSVRIGFTCLVIALICAAPLAAETNVDSADVWRWSWPPYITIPLIVSALLYLIGLLRILRRQHRLGISSAATVSFCLGWLSLVLALDSPIHEWSEQLFWMHMTQHEILVLISAPLLVLGKPGLVWLWAFPWSWRTAFGELLRARAFKSVWLCLSAPFAAWSLHALALWIWHAPKLFEATLQSDVIHAAQHISFLGTALLFWWALVQRHATRLGYGGAVLYVFTTAVHTSLLGALLTFSGRPWYPSYAATAPHWHLTAIEDQQLGGLIMWIPAGTVLLAFTLIFLARWMKQSDERWKFTRTAELLRNTGKPLDAKLLLCLCALGLATGMAGCSRLNAREVKEASVLTNGGDARAGRRAIRRYGCYTCHTIDGVPGAQGLVGPPLNGIRERYVIGGQLPNTPENMMLWIQHPHTVNPRTVMPEMNVGEQDSRDITAYLYTLR